MSETLVSDDKYVWEIFFSETKNVLSESKSKLEERQPDPPNLGHYELSERWSVITAILLSHDTNIAFGKTEIKNMKSETRNQKPLSDQK